MIYSTLLKNIDFIDHGFGTKASVYPSDRVMMHQVHGNQVCLWPNLTRSCDGLIVQKAHIVIAVATRDCVPLLLLARDKRIAAVVHAGWRGTCAGIVHVCIEKMKSLGAQPEAIVAAIGPCIRAEIYEVGPDLLKIFLTVDASCKKFFVPRGTLSEEKFLFDLPGCVRFFLEKEGVKDIDDLSLCTYTQEEMFSSHRRAAHKRQKGLEEPYSQQLSFIKLSH